MFAHVPAVFVPFREAARNRLRQMNRIDWLQLNMQFEQDGLRSSVRWRLR